MKVYLQSAKLGEPRYLQVIRNQYQFWQRGYEVELFDREDLDGGALDDDLLQNPERTIVSASVGVCRDALTRAGKPQPPNLDLPDELFEFICRRVDFRTMGEVSRWVQSESAELPVHVKPRCRHKLFTGKVVHAFRDLISLSGVPEDEPVIVQEVVSFLSEWRATILRGEIRNVANYLGDPMLFPNPEVMQAALNVFENRPIGCGMDWGVTIDGRTLLIEVNDGFALGNYGCPGHIYTAMIEARWRELMGLEDNFVGV